MRCVAVVVLLLILLGVAACGDKAPEPQPVTVHSASLEAPNAVVSRTRARPEDVVRLWLKAAKRGDAEAMSSLWATEERPRVKASSHSFAAQVASGTLHAATWQVGAEAGEFQERTVTAHVVWREHPDGGDNLEFRFVRRDGRWWLVGVVDYD